MLPQRFELVDWAFNAEIPGLTKHSEHNARRVLLLMAVRMNRNSQEIGITPATIQRLLNMKQRTVYRSLERLENAGLISSMLSYSKVRWMVNF